MREREIRVIPISIDAKALEAFALDIHVLLRPFAAQTTKRRLIDLGHLLRAERDLDHVLDRLAMTIPSRNVRREIAALRMGLVHEILQDLVERMPQVNRAIGIRRAIVQDERTSVLVLFEHLMVNVDVVPKLKTGRLILREIASHRKISFGQIHGFFVTVRHDMTFLERSFRVFAEINYLIITRNYAQNYYNE